MNRTNEELARLIKEGQTELYTELWENLKFLITSLSKKYYIVNSDRCISAGVTVDDIVQSGYFALVEAVKYFDINSGYKLTTYLNLPFKRQVNILLGRCTSRVDGLNNSLSLDIPINEDIGEMTLADTVEDENSGKDFENAERVIFNSQLKTALDNAMTALTERERSTLIDFYYNNLPLSVIARRSNGLSYSQVNSAYKNALKKIRRTHKKELKPFADEIFARALIGTGYASFINNGASSVELTVEKLQRQYEEQKRRDRAILEKLLAVRN